MCIYSCSIGSTLMDMDSTASSGRSTPALLNGGLPVGSSSAAPGGKSLSYTCCWDNCQLQFPSSPDLAEHIRNTHVDGQRGGVSVLSTAHLGGRFINISHMTVCVPCRCLCVCGKAVKFTTLLQPVRVGCRDTC